MTAKVAIVDFGMGNLFSVQAACAHAGLDATITSDPAEVEAADAVVLPGMGAFGDAMRELESKRLVAPLRALKGSGKPFLGVCLGLQLMMEESLEFGRHEGLGLIAGSVVRFEGPVEDGTPLKIPQVGWNEIRKPAAGAVSDDPWAATPLEGIPETTRVYFVHSYYAKPTDPARILSSTRYGQVEFASGLRLGSLFGFQFHPERSGALGLAMYRNFATIVGRSRASRG